MSIIKNIKDFLKPNHSRSAKKALPWKQPKGWRDRYKIGEFMIWTDGNTYLCLLDTVYSPNEYRQAWSKL